jgi:hypothetical protein
VCSSQVLVRRGLVPSTCLGRLLTQVRELDRQIETYAPPASRHLDHLRSDHLLAFVGIQHEIDVGLPLEETLEVRFLEENLLGTVSVGVRLPEAVVVDEVAVVAANAEIGYWPTRLSVEYAPADFIPTLHTILLDCRDLDRCGAARCPRISVQLVCVGINLTGCPSVAQGWSWLTPPFMIPREFLTTPCELNDSGPF